jgi:hypothetical protein
VGAGAGAAAAAISEVGIGPGPGTGTNGAGEAMGWGNCGISGMRGNRNRICSLPPLDAEVVCRRRFIAALPKVGIRRLQKEW